MTFLALDAGTSFIKGAVLDVEARRFGVSLWVPFPEPRPGLPPHWCEMDPQVIVAATERVFNDLMDDTPDCEGLALAFSGCKPSLERAMANVAEQRQTQ